MKFISSFVFSIIITFSTISTSNKTECLKDLQQCADAIMRLRAEYFFNQDNIDSICFKAMDGTGLSFAKWMRGERPFCPLN